MGSRTTGPTSHFVMVKFGDQKVEPTFTSVDPSGGEPDPEKINTVRAALASLNARVPISERYFPVEFGLTERDMADEFHYAALLRNIFAEAERSLA